MNRVPSEIPGNYIEHYRKTDIISSSDEMIGQYQKCDLVASRKLSRRYW